MWVTLTVANEVSILTQYKALFIEEETASKALGAEDVSILTQYKALFIELWKSLVSWLAFVSILTQYKALFIITEKEEK